MDRNIKNLLWAGVFLFGALIFVPGRSYANCSSPTSPHGGRDFVYSSAGSVENLCDSTDTWKNLRDVDESGAGIRQLIQFGDDEGACTSAKTGRIRYSSVGSWDYCDGSAWTALVNGSGTFLGLSDVDPTTYAGQAGNFLRVNSPQDGIEFTSDIIESIAGGAPQGMMLGDLGDVDTAGYADGSVLLYSAGASGWVPGAVSASSDRIHDADGNTQVQTEKNTNEDKIRFDTGGTERMVIDSAAVQITATPLRFQVTTGDEPLGGGGGGGGGGAGALNDLSDVSTAGEVNGKILKFNGASWVVSDETGGSLALNDLTDVNTSGYSDGSVLLYSAGASGWVPGAVSASSDRIHDADGNTQVQTEKNTNEDKIRFDTGGTERMFIDGSAVQITSTPLRVEVTTGDQPQSGALSQALNDLTDVSTAGEANGKILKFNGASWVVGDETGGSLALSDLTDVNTAGYSDGSALLYSSAASGWVAGSVSGTPAGSDKDIQFNDNGTFGYDANLVWDKVAKRLSISGDIAYTGIMTDVSDRRLKDDIMPLPPELKNILTLQPVSFSMKSDPTHAREFGLIAQDVEPVFPDLVITKPDGTKAMNYIGLISPLIAAVKEQQGLIEKQQQQITALQKQLADQARRLDALEKR
jgi:Chaperone of endosialidase